MPSTAGKKNWQGLMRTFAGLLLTLLLLLAALWLSAPRLAEWKLRTELARLGVSVPELRIRSLTPWSLELEPFRLGEEADAPTLGALCVTYSPRELLRGKVRTVTLDGARFVIRKAQSGGWEVVGLDKLLPKHADSATPAKPLAPKEILALLPDSVSVRDVSVAVATENGRMEFPVELGAVRNGDMVNVRLAAGGFGGKMEMHGVVRMPDEEILACKGNLRVYLPPRTEFGGVRFISPQVISGTVEMQWNKWGKDESIFSIDPVLLIESAEACSDGWTAQVKDARVSGGIVFEETGRCGGYYLAIGSSGLSASLSDGSVLKAEKFLCHRLDGQLQQGFDADCAIYNANLWIPQVGLVAEGLDVAFDFGWSEKEGLRKYLQHAQLICPEKVVSVIRSVKIHGVDLGVIPLQITEAGKNVRVEATVKPPGSALAATVALSANLETREVAVSATVPPVMVSEKDPLLAPFLPPALKGTVFSGMVGGRTDVTWQPGGEPKATASLTLADGKFAMTDGTFDVVGVECGLALESLVPLRSLPAQKLKFTLAHTAGTPLNDGKFAFRLDPPNTVFIEHGSFGWCGGRLTCAAARITDGKPDGMVMLRAEQVDVGQLLGLAKDFGGHAEGWLSGKVPLLFRPDGMSLGDVHLFTDPEKPGLLQLDPEKWPGNQVDTLGADPTVKKKMKLTLKDMNLNLLRLDALPGNNQGGTRLCLRFAGTPRKDGDLPPVDLTLNLNLEGRQNRLWELLNRSLPRK